MVGLVYEEQMWWCINFQQLRNHSRYEMLRKCLNLFLYFPFPSPAKFIAHCQPGFLASLVAVFGEYDISGDLESKRSVSKNVKRVIVHRQYDAATFENDLAILELESPVRYDTHIGKLFR